MFVGTHIRPLAYRLAAAGFVAAALLLSSCGRPAARSNSAPFRAEVGQLTLNVPERPDFYQARQDDGAVRIRVCNREAYYRTYERPVPGCDGLAKPIVNLYGVWTLIRRHRVDRYDLIRERPDLPPPEPVPLIDIPEGRIDRDIRGSGEAYPLSRLDTLDPEQRLQTTSRGWPVAACSIAPQGHRYCSIGFLIEDAFVEAQWHAEAGVRLDQAEVWAVATALDQKIRALVPQAEPADGAPLGLQPSPERPVPGG